MSRPDLNTPAWKATRLRVLDRDGWTCSACGKHLVGSDATVDHVEAWANREGKTYSDADLIAMCRTCNGRKSDREAVRLDYRNPRWLA